MRSGNAMTGDTFLPAGAVGASGASPGGQDSRLGTPAPEIAPP